VPEAVIHSGLATLKEGETVSEIIFVGGEVCSKKEGSSGGGLKKGGPERKESSRSTSPKFGTPCPKGGGEAEIPTAILVTQPGKNTSHSLRRNSNGSRKRKARRKLPQEEEGEGTVVLGFKKKKPLGKKASSFHLGCHTKGDDAFWDRGPQNEGKRAGD